MLGPRNRAVVAFLFVLAVRSIPRVNERVWYGILEFNVPLSTRGAINCRFLSFDDLTAIEPWTVSLCLFLTTIHYVSRDRVSESKSLLIRFILTIWQPISARGADNPIVEPCFFSMILSSYRMRVSKRSKRLTITHCLSSCFRVDRSLIVDYT